VPEMFNFFFKILVNYLYTPEPSYNHEKNDAENTTPPLTTIFYFVFFEGYFIVLLCKIFEKNSNTPGLGTKILTFLGAMNVVLMCNKFGNTNYVPWKILKFS